MNGQYSPVMVNVPLDDLEHIIAIVEASVSEELERLKETQLSIRRSKRILIDANERDLAFIRNFKKAFKKAIQGQPNET